MVIDKSQNGRSCLFDPLDKGRMVPPSFDYMSCDTAVVDFSNELIHLAKIWLKVGLLLCPK